VTSWQASPADLVRRLEAHAIDAWPATVTERVDAGGVVGLFCLAVDPARRRAGLGTALVRALLAGSSARVAYLQVEASNAPAVALYARLGFGKAYRYCHRVALAPG
jgi:ribosomal protein S18 acetylase RimI-like enzyme